MKMNLILVLLIALISCGKDGVFPSKEKKIIGTWTLQSISYTKDVQYMSNKELKFEENGTFSETIKDLLANDTTYIGNWIIEKGELTFMYDNGKVSKQKVEKLTKKDLELKAGAGERTEKYIKN